MQAIVIDNYGGPEVLNQRQLDTPKPGSKEVLVKVAASSINPIDFKIRQGALKFILNKKFPIVLGHDLSGEVVGLGSQISQFSVGDNVFGMNQFPNMGAYAEYVVVKEKYLAKAPLSISSSTSASVPLAALTALQGLRDFGKLEKGQEVIINGASGGVGTFAVQLAKQMGAHVTAVCSSKNIDLVLSLGADVAIDYQQQRFEDLPTNFDLVFDVVGKSSYTKSRLVMKRKGFYVTTIPAPSAFIWQGLTKLTQQTATPMWVKSNTGDLNILGAYIDNNTLKPIVENTYSAEELHAAMQHAETERTVGKLVIKMTFNQDG